MTCYHEVEGSPGVLRACATDPCSKHAYKDDIHADSIIEARRIYEQRIAAETPRPTPMRKRTRRKPIRNHSPHDVLITSRMTGRSINADDLDAGSDQISAVITDDQWSQIQSATDSIYAMYGAVSHGNTMSTKDFSRLQQKIAGLIRTSPDPSMRAVRQYLGDEVSADDIAHLITACPHSLNAPAIIQSNNSVARCLLTRTSNDMDKRRVIATILFFGGRCCYCGKPIHKAKNKQVKADTATADHLDPIQPDNNNDTPGETKFGNVVLCCHACNEAKGNKTMTAFISETRTIPNNKKIAAIDMIRSFRKYSLYTPMNDRQAIATREQINKLQKLKNSKADKETMRSAVLLASSEIRELR
jgi:5-methylcytosine-specific restriction endonuclease McrA